MLTELFEKCVVQLLVVAGVCDNGLDGRPFAQYTLREVYTYAKDLKPQLHSADVKSIQKECSTCLASMLYISTASMFDGQPCLQRCDVTEDIVKALTTFVTKEGYTSANSGNIGVIVDGSSGLATDTECMKLLKVWVVLLVLGLWTEASVLVRIFLDQMTMNEWR